MKYLFNMNLWETYFVPLITFGGVFCLLLLIIALFKRIYSSSGTLFGGYQRPRLTITEEIVLDNKRKLLKVQDGKFHYVILLGPTSEQLIKIIEYSEEIIGTPPGASLDNLLLAK